MPPRRDLSDRFARGGAAHKKRRPTHRPNVPLAAPPAAEPAAGAADTGAAAPARPLVTTGAAPASRPFSTFAQRRQSAMAGQTLRGARSSPLVTDFEAVRRDLRRIAILAGSIGVVLVVLSFVIK